MLLISRPVSASHNLSMVSRLSKNSEVKNCYYMICVKTNLCRRSHPTITESNSTEIHKYANSLACENSMEFLSLDRVQVNRWVADVLPRETSPATRNEGKRLFSQDTNNFIYIRIGNSMISSDICHKYHEWYFKIVIRNLRQFWNITSGIYAKYQY